MRQVENTDTLVRVTPLLRGVTVDHEELREQIKGEVMIHRTANEIGSEHIEHNARYSTIDHGGEQSISLEKCQDSRTNVNEC